MGLNKYSLLYLCKMYVRYVCIVGDGYMRVKLHNAIEQRLKTGNAEKLSEILHNLDKYVECNPEFIYTDENAEILDKMGEKLYYVLKSEVMVGGE